MAENGFNPYYSTTPPPSSQKQNQSFNTTGFISSQAGTFAGDLDGLTAKGPYVKYQNTDANGRPTFDNQYYNDYGNSLKPNKGAAILESTGKYAAAGSSAGPYGALIGGAIGAGVGLFKAKKEDEDYNKYTRSYYNAQKAFSLDLSAYNKNQAGKEVSMSQQSQYASKNPYDAPSQAYWYA